MKWTSLKRTQLPECFGNYIPNTRTIGENWRDACCLCFCNTECMRETTGITDYEVRRRYDDLEEFKKACYQDAVDLGLIHPTTKPEHLDPLMLWKALASKFNLEV